MIISIETRTLRKILLRVTVIGKTTSVNIFNEFKNQPIKNTE